MSQEKLFPHEWLAISAMVIALLLLIGLTQFRSKPSSLTPTTTDHYLVSPQIEVSIEGAVVYPGSYLLARESRVKDLLAIAQPLPSANLKKIKPESKLRDGRLIKVPFFAMMKIVLQGAVEVPGEHLVKKGLFLNELPHWVELHKDADMAFFDKKQRLKEGQQLNIPFKKK